MNLKKMADTVRILSADMVEKAGSGHPGMPLGMADVATVLWTHFLKFDPKAPSWFDRDRFVLSNGHGSALLYSLLYLTGFPDFSLDDLKSFRQWNSRTPGHPELGPGVDFSTGPLGQGLAGAVGLALAERMMNARFGDALVNHRTYVFVGDGCLMEGISEEAISLAGQLNLNRLIVFWDDNHITIDGSTDLVTHTNQQKRFEANGWQVLKCNGHNYDDIMAVIEKAQHSDRPVLIDCKTIIGYGAPSKAGSSKSHGAALGPDEIKGLRENLNWPDMEPFKVPEEILEAFHSIGLQNAGKRQQWEERLAHSPDKELFVAAVHQQLPDDLKASLSDYKKKLVLEKPEISTRQASQKALDVLVQKIDILIGGSADLSASCLTMTSKSIFVTANDYAGNYINYGIREHAMAAVMNGLSVHGGFIPYGSTFLSFVDYMKPAIRLGCLMKQKEIYVLTHDSIAIGEDGPTHQPVEQLASLRATPNLAVFRPADSVEVVESYEKALSMQNPSAIILTRQKLPMVRTDVSENLTALGGYVLYEPSEQRQITFLASGSEIQLVLKAKEILKEQNIAAAVVSMPCWRLFEEQPLSYRQQVLGQAPCVAVEMASSFGWDRFIGEKGAIISIDMFGRSAPGEELIKQYGFTPENIVRIVLEILSW